MFNFPVKVYYEDTDSGGVVYYANYLKFTERARTNMIQELGFTLNQLHNDHDCLFIVKKVSCEYLQSAKLEDGILRISLVKNIPDAMKPQKISIK